jgi:hypothetical protein
MKKKEEKARYIGILVVALSALLMVFSSCGKATDEPPLWQAERCARAGDVAGLRTIADADPSLVRQKENYDKRTLLHSNFPKGFFDDKAREIGDLLIAAGSNIDAVDDRGMTPAHCACYYGHGGQEALA